MIPPEAPVGRLVVCPTPIGNLADITLRALDELRGADLVACEDTRRTRLLLDRHGIDARLVSLHEHNEASRAAELCRRIAAGEAVALVSDAGTPAISDPGFALVRGCLQQGLPVEVLPGASAVTTALVASGLPAPRWCFAGFLPRRRGELRSLLLEARMTLVAFESPRRLAATLASKKGEPTDHAKRLVEAIHAVLNEAIRAGGSSLRDHRQTSGELGYFQHSFQVYDREGEPCRSKGCEGIVRRFTQNGRSTFWCPKCQK